MTRLFRQTFGFLAYYTCFVFYLVLLPLVDRRETDDRFRKRLRKATQLALRAFGVRVVVQGTENLESDSNSIIVANHSSWFDQLALIASLQVPVAFVTNEKYFRYRGLGAVLRKLGSVPVSHSDVASSLGACRKSLADGRWLVIYPEGTRSSVLLPFRRGAAVLAQQTGLAIQPIVIRGAQDVLARGRSLFHVRPGVITLQVLPRMYKQEALSTQQCMDSIQDCFVLTDSPLNRPAAPPAPSTQRPTSTQQPCGEPNLASPADGQAETQLPALSGDLSADAEPLPDVNLADLQASNGWGGFYLVWALVMTSLSIALSLSSNFFLWVGGQLLLAVTLIQWFAILHEAGHKTLFSTRGLNRWAAHLAGFFALIPADCWRLVHAKHHYWTGWQDLDVTTETLVPRKLRRYERWVINICWRCWIPLFASLYRWNNYWNLPRLRKMFPRPRQRRQVTANVIAYLLVYLAIGIWLGVDVLLKTFGLAILVTLSLQDLLILSQHTHIPMKLAAGKAVKPFTPMQQEVFTRSLVFPQWFARLILLNVDAHGLHHMLPRIPGYHLHRLSSRKTMNRIRWWQWIWRAKTVPGEILLFQNRDQTGFFF